jgi:hypothetical protein
MPVDVKELIPGRELPSSRFVLDPKTVKAYRDAVGDTSAVFQEASPIVPPSAVAALSLRHLLDVLGLPPGTLHTGQELSFHRIALVDQEMSCLAKVAQAAQRKGWLTLVIEFETSSADGTCVTGRSTLFLIPEGTG